MFGIGITEIIVILVIALLLIGPDKLPELARTLGKGLSEFKNAAEDFRDSVKVDFHNESNQNRKIINEPTTTIDVDNEKGEKDKEESTDESNEDNNNEDNKVET